MCQCDGYAVGDLEAALLAQVLYALYELAGYALGTQLGGYGDVECHGEGAFAGDAPSRYVLAEDLDVFEVDGDAVARGQSQRQVSAFELGNLLLGECCDCSIDILHQLAKLLAHGAEVAFHLLAEKACSLHELQSLDVDLVEYELLHRLDA